LFSQLKLTDSLVSSLSFRKVRAFSLDQSYSHLFNPSGSRSHLQVGDNDLAYVSGVIELGPEDGSLPVLKALPGTLAVSEANAASNATGMVVAAPAPSSSVAPRKPFAVGEVLLGEFRKTLIAAGMQVCIHLVVPCALLFFFSLFRPVNSHSFLLF
jgi:hypothetical protein